MCGGDHGGELGCGGLGKEDVEMGKKLRGSQDVGSEEVADRTVFVQSGGTIPCYTQGKLNLLLLVKIKMSSTHTLIGSPGNARFPPPKSRTHI